MDSSVEHVPSGRSIVAADERTEQCHSAQWDRAGRGGDQTEGGNDAVAANQVVDVGGDKELMWPEMRL